MYNLISEPCSRSHSNSRVENPIANVIIYNGNANDIIIIDRRYNEFRR